jgi:uncharacterized protein
VTLHQPLLGRGHVRHQRLHPVAHRFAYASYFWRLPMRSLEKMPCPALHRNRWGAMSFHDADHGDGRENSLHWLDALLAEHGIVDAQGEVWLQCYPRVLGYVFKPVSFWFCHRLDDSLAAVVAEVNNTFGERHCYLLSGPDLAWGRVLSANKGFHVSPFLAVQGQYQFCFMQRQGTAQHPSHCLARIDHTGPDGRLLLRTSVAGQLQPLTRRNLRAAFWGVPFMTWGVMLRIHWQAWKLWRLQVPFFRKPPAPSSFTSR